MTTPGSPPPVRKSRKVLLLILLAAVFLLSSLGWRSAQTTPPPATTPGAAHTASPASDLTPTPRFPEFYTNQDQTNGIVLGSTVLVLIVIIGTLTVLRHSTRRPPDAP